MSNPDPFLDPPLTPTRAKLLNRKAGTPYKILANQFGEHWLVERVLDDGRMILIIRSGSHGKVHQNITAPDYKHFTIVIGPNQLNALSAEHDS